MNIHQQHRQILTILIISLVMSIPAVTYASVAMTLPQYVNEILLNNHSLRAGMKNVEADYYSVLAAVGSQRPSISGTLTGSYATKQATEYNVFAGLGSRRE